MTGIRIFIVCVALTFVSTAYGEPVSVRGWSHPNFGRIVFDWKTPVTYTARASGRHLTVNFNKPIETQFAPALKNLRIYIKNASITSNGHTVQFALAGEFSLRSFKNDGAVVLDLQQHQTPPKRKRDGIVPKALWKAEKRIGSAAQSLLSLEFGWPEVVGAAVFKRAGIVWIAFDRHASVDLAPIRQTGTRFLSHIEQLPVRDATLLRMVPAKDLSLDTRRKGTNWIVDFKRGRVRPDVQISVDVVADANEGAHVVFSALDVGGLIRVQDTAVGDLIQVATFKASNHGIQRRRAYPEFQILQSAQGLAVVGLSDDVELAKSNGRLLLRSPGGLHISSIPFNSVENSSK